MYISICFEGICYKYSVALPLHYTFSFSISQSTLCTQDIVSL